jgi:hypothetical protein
MGSPLLVVPTLVAELFPRIFIFSLLLGGDFRAFFASSWTSAEPAR